MKFVLASVPVFVGKTVVFAPSTVMVAGALPPVLEFPENVIVDVHFAYKVITAFVLYRSPGV